MLLLCIRRSADVHLEFLAAVLLAELAEGFLLDLADVLARQAETLADLLQRQRVLPSYLHRGRMPAAT
jgi:hypothetical protein